MKKFVSLIIAVLLLINLPAQAQDFTGQLTLLNQSPPERNPDFKRAQDIFDMHIVNDNRQLIGDVADLTVNQNGEVVFLTGLINWESGDEYTIIKPYEEVIFHEPVSAFQIPFSGDKETVTRLEADENTVSIKRLLDKELRSVTGRNMGVIRTILFNDDVTAVRALVLENVPRAGRYERIAIPFDSAYLEIGRRYGEKVLYLKRIEAGELIDYARER